MFAKDKVIRSKRPTLDSTIMQEINGKHVPGRHAYRDDKPYEQFWRKDIYPPAKYGFLVITGAALIAIAQDYGLFEKIYELYKAIK